MTEGSPSAASSAAQQRAALIATRALTRPALIRDAAIVLGLLTGFFLLASRFDLFERLAAYVRPREGTLLDEVVISLAFLTVVLVVVIAIRWREMRNALVRSLISEQATITARLAAENANRAKSDFLTNMSHEIRTPMNGIIGMTELTLLSDLTTEQRGYLETVRTSADALLALLNDVLDFSRLEARRLEIELSSFELSQVLDEAMRLLAPHSHGKGLELAYDIAPEVPPILGGDPARLRQIILNLAGNAVKFTAAGEVIVRVALEEPVGIRAVLHFTVSDTGIGIAPDKQATIFDAFTQADASATRRFGGTGLGLAVAAQLVTLMGGKIWVDSDIGRGSAFHFTLPFQAPAEAPAKPSRGALTDLQGMAVLVVDDNSTNLRILEAVLIHWGMRPTIVDGARAAMLALEHAHASGAPFPFALIDLQMPDLDGFQLAEQIQRRPELGTPMIMMLSSVGQGGDAERCRELGVASYMTKPVRQSLLLEAMLDIHAARHQPPPQPVPATALPAAKAGRSCRILLAEDNVVNQQVAAAILGKNGHTLVMVANGRQAVAAALRGSFDVVLMDVQMPDMDGLEATAAIRAAERGTGRHVPIIALTANALVGDREACLAAGMDAFLTKPLHPVRLLEAIQTAAGAGSPPAPIHDEESTFDRADVLERLEGDLGLLSELVVLFKAQTPRMRQELRRTLDANDAKGVERVAHTLRGSASSLGGTGVARTALALEVMGRDNLLTGGDEQLAALDRGLISLERDLAALAGGAAA